MPSACQALFRMVPQGRARGTCAILDRPEAGDAEQSAAHRPLEVFQPLPEHGARHAWVDACVRLGPGACRHRERSEARARIPLPRVGGQTKRSDPFDRPRLKGLKAWAYFAPTATRFFAATSLGLGTASTVSSRTKFG